jgi:uncharacterized protein YecE (DUF72 family)
MSSAERDMRGSAFVGTSGWSYPQWRDGFYAGVRRSEWLAHCAGRFTGIEVDATFYGRAKPATLERWAAATPPRFRFALKAHRYFTHQKKLEFPLAALLRERDNARAMGGKAAAILWQLPRNLARDAGRLEDFLGRLAHWPELRHAIEFRHPSWFDAEVAAALARTGVANCQSDAADWPCWEAVTTDLVYVRLHGHTRTYVSGYAAPSLRAWARRIDGWCAQGRDVHVYFDNTDGGRAPRDASRLIAMLDLPIPTGAA